MYLAVTVCAFLYSAHRARVFVPGMPPFWDARVYLRALTDWRRGADPYISAAPSSPGTILPFVSPPLFLWLTDVFYRVLPGHLGLVAYLVLTSLSTLCIPALLSRYYIRSSWLPAALCLGIVWFQPGRYGSQALLSGNVSNILYALVLLGGAFGLRRNRWLPFYLAVIFAGLMKPPFLAFLLLPLLMEPSQWRWCLGATAVVVMGDLTQIALAPQFWREFQRNVYVRVFLERDAGFGLLGQWQDFAPRLPLLRHLSPMEGTTLILVPLFAALVVLRRRHLSGAGERLWIPCLLVFATLCNPRILAYDEDIAVLPALFITLEVLGQLPQKRWRYLLTGLLTVSFLDVLVSAPETATCLLLVGSVLLFVVQQVCLTPLQ